MSSTTWKVVVTINGLIDVDDTNMSSIKSAEEFGAILLAAVNKCDIKLERLQTDAFLPKYSRATLTHTLPTYSVALDYRIVIHAGYAGGNPAQAKTSTLGSIFCPSAAFGERDDG